jgi:hypothetical protein
MGTVGALEVAWLNEEADNDPRKKQNRRQQSDAAEDDDWTREYDVDQEIEDQERRCDSRLGHIDRIGRVLDAVIVVGLWGCALFYYWIWFLGRHPADSSSSSHHDADGRPQHLLHIAVVIATVLLGVLYGARGVGVCGLRIITGMLLTVQVSLFLLLMLNRSFYVQQHHHRHGILLFHLLCVVSGTAVGSEFVRFVLIVVMQLRRRRSEIDQLQEPLLDGVEWQTRQQEWASRTEEDPLWWSREEEDDDNDDDDGETVYSRAGRSSAMFKHAGSGALFMLPSTNHSSTSFRS